MPNPISALKEAGYQIFYTSYSALDRFFKVSEPGPVYLLTDSSLINLARTFDDLRYPQSFFADAVVDHNHVSYFFRCYEESDPLPPVAFPVQELLYDPGRDVFLDPRGIYRELRRDTLSMNADPAAPLFLLSEAARLVSRYHYRADSEACREFSLPEPSAELQRELLISILSGRRPDKGLSLLYSSGFIEAFWPELHELSFIPHIKDYHPEGNAWEHTLETFKYRKECDLTLSLGLLLHDVGKPASTGTMEKPFDGHAEVGEEIARRFLKRLGFPAKLIREVAFLVRHHMLPPALKRLPLYRTRKIMDSGLFPLLLELYRADLSASYWNQDGYYDACRVYRSFLKNKLNPYRREDGKKQVCRNHS